MRKRKFCPGSVYILTRATCVYAPGTNLIHDFYADKGDTVVSLGDAVKVKDFGYVTVLSVRHGLVYEIPRTVLNGLKLDA